MFFGAEVSPQELKEARRILIIGNSEPKCIRYSKEAFRQQRLCLSPKEVFTIVKGRLSSGSGKLCGQEIE